MWLERFELFTAPGFERGELGLREFSPNINVIFGPNSSGKSTLLRAIVHCLKPSKEMYLAQASWVTSQGTVLVDVKGAKRKFGDSLQESIFTGGISAALNPLDYLLSVDSLATASLESNDAFIATLMRELRGGIDFSVLTAGGFLDVHPRRLQSLAKKVKEAERETKKIDKQYEVLVAQEAALSRLESQRRNVEQRLRDCALEKRLVEIRELSVNLLDLERWITQQPEVIQAHSPQTFKRLLELEEEIPSLKRQLEILLENKVRLDRVYQQAIFSNQASVGMIEDLLDVWRNYRAEASEIELLQNHLLSNAERVRVIEKYFLPVEAGKQLLESAHHPVSSELDLLDELLDRLETEKSGQDTLLREYELYRQDNSEAIDLTAIKDESIGNLRQGGSYQVFSRLADDVFRIRNLVLVPVLIFCGALLFFLYRGQGEQFLELRSSPFILVPVLSVMVLVSLAVFMLGIKFSAGVITGWQNQLIDEYRSWAEQLAEKISKAGREVRLRQLKSGIEFHQANIAKANEGIIRELTRIGCVLPKGNIQRALIVTLLRERFALLAEDAGHSARLLQLQKLHADNRLGLSELLGGILRTAPGSLAENELISLVSRIKEEFPDFQNLRLDHLRVEQQIDILRSSLASLVAQQESLGVSLDFYRLHFDNLELVEQAHKLFLAKQSEYLKLKQRLIAIEEETARQYQIDEQLLREKINAPADDNIVDAVIELETREKELAKQVADIQFAIRAARESHQREDSQSRSQRAMRDYTEELKRSAHAIAAQFVLQNVEKDYQSKYSPELLLRAAGMFSRFTNGVMEMRLSTSSAENGVVEFWDSSREQNLQLGQLSRGTKTQAILAARLAYLFAGERGESLPILLDEALSASDSVRYSEIGSMLQALALDGRQIFYCTCRDEEASFWRRLADTSTGQIVVHDLAST